jgi:hypothetical protein
MNKNVQGVVAIIAAGFVMVSAMFNPWVSMIISVVALVGLGIWQMASGKSGSRPALDLIGKESAEKEERKNKILKFFETNSKADNNDVQKLLGVSDATAERYLDELEDAGVLKQEGSVGQSVYYIKN